MSDDLATVESLAVELRAAGRVREADAIRRAAGLIHQPVSPLTSLGISAEIVARALAIDLVAPVIYRRPGGGVAALEYRGARTTAGLLVGVGLVGGPSQRWAIVESHLDSVGQVLALVADSLSRPPSDEDRAAAQAALDGLSDECRGAIGGGL